MLALCSAGASPGVSTLAVLLAAASPEPAVVVEADPDGGCFGARLDLLDEPGLVTLAAAARHGVHGDLLAGHAQSVTATSSVVIGPASAQAMTSVLSASAEVIAATLQSTRTARVMVDCGRLSPGSAAWPLARAAEMIVLLARPRLDEARRLPSRVAELRSAGVPVGLVVVGERPFSPVEVADVADVELLGVIADDVRTAAMVNGAPGSERVLRRSGLWRSVTVLAETFADRLASEARAVLPEGTGSLEVDVVNGRR